MTDDATSLTVKVQVDAEGLGDGETHTIDAEVAEEVSALVTANLRERYSHLDADTDIGVMAVTAPNTVLIHRNEPTDDT